MQMHMSFVRNFLKHFGEFSNDIFPEISVQLFRVKDDTAHKHFLCSCFKLFPYFFLKNLPICCYRCSGCGLSIHSALIFLFLFILPSSRRAIWNLLRVEWENIKQMKSKSGSKKSPARSNLKSDDEEEQRPLFIGSNSTSISAPRSNAM
mmetsp:Transcript_25292/g.37785  ORF Transcript_25292/g.37785 Transcript_25292/m.37785 type:complete len:149 (-) Transcript_25292:378-824(-)